MRLQAGTEKAYWGQPVTRPKSAAYALGLWPCGSGELCRFRGRGGSVSSRVSKQRPRGPAVSISLTKCRLGLRSDQGLNLQGQAESSKARGGARGLRS